MKLDQEDRTTRAPSKVAVPPARGRRFRIVKLEERIAPKKGGKGTQNCPTLTCGIGD
jgi:hypothetical protein